MLHKASSHITQQLLIYGAITKDDYELYEFAAFCFLFNLIPLLLSMIIGAVLNLFWESILFIAPYISIRTFSGGFHLKSSLACFIATSIILIACLIITEQIIIIGESSVYIATTLLSSTSIFFLSPIDSEARKLSVPETKAFRRIARCLVVAYTAVVLILYWMDVFAVTYPICMGIILTATLQLPCCIRASR